MRISDRGIRGAAIATVIGQLIGAAAALWFNRVKNPVIHVRLKGYRFLWQDVADIYRVGLPTIVMQAIGSVMTFAVNGILLGVSSTAVAFFGIYYKLQNFLMMPVNGLGQAAIPVVGFNYGSGQSDRVKQAWKVLVPCLWLLIRTMGIEKAWFAFWVSEVIACAYSLWATKKELRNKGK